MNSAGALIFVGLVIAIIICAIARSPLLAKLLVLQPTTTHPKKKAQTKPTIYALMNRKSPQPTTQTAKKVLSPFRPWRLKHQ